MSREQKNSMYYFLSKGYYGHLLTLCDSIISKKGKDPIPMFWKAFALGASGNINEALRQLDNFQARKDLQFPVSLAMLYFHQKAPVVDREAVDMLTAEISVAEDIAKEPGNVLAARFSLYTKDFSQARRITEKILTSSSGFPASVFEHDALGVDYWCTVFEYESRINDAGSAYTQSLKKKLSSYETTLRNKYDQVEVDTLLAFVKAKQLLEAHADALNILNQMIAMHPWYTNALSEKAVMLASMQEWEQALDTAQRALDVDGSNIDAMKIIVVHAFTQESQPDDAIQKFLDLEKAVTSREPYSPKLALQITNLMSKVCARQPRVLDICVKMLERAQKNVDTPEEEAEVLAALGGIRLFQGPSQYSNAVKVFKEAIRKDGANVHALQGMIKYHLLEGQLDDAEAQLELLTMMHPPEELGYEYHFIKAHIAKELHRDQKQHFELLEDCKRFLFRQISDESRLYYHSFGELLALNPDFALLLAVEYYNQVQGTVLIPFTTASIAANAEDEENGMNVTGNGATMTRGGNMATAKNTTMILGGNKGVTMTMGLGTMTTMGLGTMIGSVGPGGKVSRNKAMLSAMKDEENSSMSSGVESSPALLACVSILQKILKYCPGHISPYIELSRCHVAQGLPEEASRQLRQCLSLQPTSCPALIALAKVDISRQKTIAANRSLEQALAADFSIRSSTLFRLMQVYVKAQQGKYDECIADMEKLITLSEFKSLSSHTDPTNHSDSLGGLTLSVQPTDPLRVTNDEKAGAYITHAYLLSKTKRLKEAKQVLAEAKVLFAGTDQEVQILVASSQLAVERKDYDAAIRMLDKISEESAAYVKAQTMKADILLTHHRDKEGYTECYKSLVERDPSARNYAALGEAYLKILSPELAVDALEQAYRIDPIVNSRLRSRIGRALIATHEYFRAIEFYENSIKEVMRGASSILAVVSSPITINAEAISLSQDLAKLYKKLGRFDSSVRVLNQILHENPHDLSEMKQDVLTLLLLSEVQAEQGNSSQNESKEDSDAAAATKNPKSPKRSNIKPTSEYIATLLKAKNIQKDLVNMLRSTSSSSTEVIEEEREILSDICERVGAAYSHLNDTTKSSAAYAEAILYDPSNTDAILGNARFYRSKGDLESCKVECQKVIHIDPSNSEAAVMLSEILFQTTSSNISFPAASGSQSTKQSNAEDGIMSFNDNANDAGETKTEEKANGSKLVSMENIANEISLAVKPLQDLLLAQPNNYHALIKMIQLLRRAGKLNEVPTYLTNAEQNDRRYIEHAGYHYCMGSYCKYTNDVGKAIAEFNLARRDDRWGQDSLIHMIDLYLNPDQETIWESNDEPTSGEVDDQITQNLNAAETLLKELEPKAKNPLRFKVLENYYLMATRQKNQIAKAVTSFRSIYDQDPDFLPGVLGLATAYMMEKDEHKAHNILKRVAKMEWSEDDGEDFDRANLLLAKSYADKSKYNLAEEICHRCLTHNRSSSPAWEILGLIHERSSNYQHAVECYEKAWKLEFEASATVGFKLAFCYMKNGQYVESIDVCENVLQQYPDYPRIREEILKKAQENIRTLMK